MRPLPTVFRYAQKLLVTAASVPAWILPQYRTSTISSRLIGRLIPPETLGLKRVGPARRPFRFQADDHYWMRILSPLYSYEQEVVFAISTGVDSGMRTFVDGGANLGFMSVLFADQFQSTHSIEATSENFKMLQSNIGDAAAVYHLALWDVDGERVQMTFEGDEHPSAHVESITEEGGTLRGEVETTTLDSILSDASDSDMGATIVKLDVEGAEERTLIGAERTIAQGATFILEDHGKDINCESYAAAMRLFDSPTVALLTQAGAIEIRDQAHLRSLKKHAGVGYNIIVSSAKDGPGRDLIDRLTAGHRRTTQERIWELTQFLGWDLRERIRGSAR